MKLRRFALVLPIALLWLSAFYALRVAQIAAAPRAQAAPVTAAQAGLAVTATVGLQDGVCASAQSVRVFPGTQVYYCYTAVNTGATTLITHTIRDTNGIAWDEKSGPDVNLPPGATFNTVEKGYKPSATALDDQLIEVTWMASGVTATVVATSVANIQVITPALQITATVGLSPTACAGDSRVVVPAGGDVQYCLIVANSGPITLTRHQVSDSDLGLSGSFDYPLGPAQRLTITQAMLPQLGLAGSLLRTDVTRTLTNTVAYTATTVDGYAFGNAGAVNATVFHTATAAAHLATAQVVFTKTIGTQESVCADTTNLSISDPNTPLYYCAILHNTGGVTLTQHVLAEPNFGLSLAFTHTLAPDDIFRITNDVLANELDQARQFGPFTLYNGSNLILDNTMLYTGSVPAAAGLRAYTVTAGAGAFAGLNVTSTPTPTFTPTRQSSDSSPTNTPWPTSTPTWTPIPPAPTPTPTDTPPFPTETPTPTRSYAISLLETPTSVAFSPLDTPFNSPLEAPVDAAAMQATLVAQSTFDALATAGSSLYAPQSPLDTPTPVLATPSPAVMVVLVTETPTPPALLVAPVQRPVLYPTPTSTPDILLFAARVADKVTLAAGWIWFALGSLVFFAVAGLMAGLSFRQAERRRFDLSQTGADPFDIDGFLPPAPHRPDPGEDDWPDSLP